MKRFPFSYNLATAHLRPSNGWSRDAISSTHHGNVVGFIDYVHTFRKIVNCWFAYTKKSNTIP